MSKSDGGTLKILQVMINTRVLTAIVVGLGLFIHLTTAQWVDASGNLVSDNGINASEFSTLCHSRHIILLSGAAGVVNKVIHLKQIQ
ncbi:MAG: hypothetical protein H0A76_10000 [Candidatus Thiodubiliella endoseptemdiera]|uniref:Uncharacterized protein n=1 Tax=Candidatus Thiodubiliella endoseptemdiera TaxID=2738886 RepID=A0A853F6M7_9GAMM|nr:hypothetical protein [Candidatus Thiodubiliella endoseptemdiera]